MIPKHEALKEEHETIVDFLKYDEGLDIRLNPKRPFKPHITIVTAPEKMFHHLSLPDIPRSISLDSAEAPALITKT